MSWSTHKLAPLIASREVTRPIANLPPPTFRTPARDSPAPTTPRITRRPAPLSRTQRDCQKTAQSRTQPSQLTTYGPGVRLQLIMQPFCSTEVWKSATFTCVKVRQR